MNENIDHAVETTWLSGLAPGDDGAVPGPLSLPLFDGPQRTYAVFDVATVNEGLELVEGEPGFCGSLLEGDEADDLADVMPCLLELTADDNLMRKLFRVVPGVPDAMGTVHLWSANPCVFIRSTAPAEQLRRHLRRFLKPEDAKGVRRYVRLWNPGIAFDYLHDLEAVTSFLLSYLSPKEGPLTLIARRDDRAVIARLRQPGDPKARTVLSDVDIRALTKRVRSEFHQKLIDRVLTRGDTKGRAFDRDRVAFISGQVMDVMQTHEPRDVPKMKDHEKLTLVLLLMHDDATSIVLNGPVIQNHRLPWAKRVDIVAKSYVTGLRRMNGVEVL